MTEPRSAPPRWIALVIFALALLLRLAFWLATDDASWAHSALYKGDAPMWARYGASPDPAGPFPLGVPLRPPGIAMLLAALGGEIALAKLVWCVLGAAAASMLYLAARPFGLAVSLIVGLGSAAATQLLILSTSLNNEAPYLALVAFLLWTWIGVEERAPPALLAAWSGAHALACLVRVEHVLFLGVSVLVLALRWNRRGDGARAIALRLAILVASFVACLLPWHLDAWARCHRFNHDEPALTRQAERRYRALATSVRHVRWSAEARSEATRLPAFCRRPMMLFVAATVSARGRDVVEPDDFRILEEAFGYVPEGIDERPFVALYGGLNFYLANDPTSDGGFTRRLLDRPPTLAGGAHSYPVVLLHGLPPPSLTLNYPPHLEIINRGYFLGLEQISKAPGATLRLLGRKLTHATSGAVPTFSGWSLPLGDDSLRRMVDLAVPTGIGATLWRIAWMAVVAVGLMRAWRLAPAVPWLLFALARVLTVLAFYGYARQGALALPVVLLLVGIVAARRLDRIEPRRLLIAAGIVGLCLLAAEATRWSLRPTIMIDGDTIHTSASPWPLGEHQDRRIEIQTF